MHLLTRALLTLVMAAVAGCAPTPPSVLLFCSTDSDCAAGYVCVLAGDGVGRCDPHDAGHTPLSDAAVPDEAGVGGDAGELNDGGRIDAGPDDAGANDAGANDAGANDAGANDAGANDAGAIDAGANDAGPLESDWPAVGWTARRRLTLSAPDEAVAAGAPIRVSLGATDTLMNGGRALGSGDDLRLWHFDGQRWRELARVLSDPGGEGGFRGDALKPPHVMVRAVLPIAHNASDPGYWLYYDNPSAGPPPTAGVPAQRSKLTFVPALPKTSSTTLAEVANVMVTASSADEVWIVVATWQQRFTDSLSFNRPAGVAQLMVDDAPLVNGVVQSARNSNDRWVAGVAMTALKGDTTPHEVSLHFSSVMFEGITDEAEIRDVRLLAFVVPTRANETVLETDLPINDVFGDLSTQTYATAWTMPLEARPTSPHLWLSQNLLREAPGVAAGNARLFFDDVIIRSTDESWLDGEMFHTLFHVGLASLDGPHDARLDYVASSGPGSSVAGVTNVLLPLEGFRYEVFTGVTASTDSLTEVSMGSLEVPATTLEHEYLYLGVVGSTHTLASNDGTLTTVRVELDGQSPEELGRSERAMGRDGRYVMSLGIGARELRKSPAILRVFAAASSANVPARVESPFLIWLRYPEVTMTAGPPEDAP